MIKDFIEKHQLPSYRQNQFNKAFYQDLIESFDELTTFPISLREELKDAMPFFSLTLKKQQISQNNDTLKALFKTSTNQLIETVLMNHQDNRHTVCVSCMSGCPVNCTFCATGKLGFKAHLTATEIIDQVLYFARLLKKSQQKITNVVFMGMGEPMLNLPAVQRAISILNDPDKFNLGMRHITISTSGYLPQLETLIKDGFRGRLAISLHAPTQEIRQTLMPVAKIYPLDQLFRLLDKYVILTNKRISYEYILINEINDQAIHAKELVRLLQNRFSHVNLIPYNPIKNAPFTRSTKKSIHRFAHILKLHNIPHSIRITMGEDIAAACGQLANQS